jgi:DNA-binding XRE family transcriptional regulator
MKKKKTVYVNRLRWYRERAGLYQRELADRAGLTPQHVHHIEKGHLKPRFDTQRKIVKALRLPMSERPSIFP